MKYLFTIALSTLFLSLQAQTVWDIDKSHSNIKFTVTHMAIAEVEGHFDKFTAAITSKNPDFSNSDVFFSADIASIDTGNDKRDGHLKSDDFFNAEKYPQLTFEGTLLKEGDDYRLVGDLTIRDVTQQHSFDVKYLGTVDTGNGRKAGFKISGEINRFEYGLEWDNAIQDGTLVVGEDINITCNVELNAQPEQ